MSTYNHNYYYFSVWIGYVPEMFVNESPVSGPLDSSPMQTKAMEDFVIGMNTNVQTFRIKIGNGTKKPGNAEKGCLTRILAYDIKKIRIHDRVAANKYVSFSVTKETYDLLPRSSHRNTFDKRISNNRIRILL